MSDLRSRLQSSLGGAYTLGEELGGGLSRVFAARETALGRDVVIKVLPPELASAVSVERFRREIELVAGLQQPFIVPVLQAGEADGLLYYTMPRVAGESLQSRLSREGQLPVADTLHILHDVLGALAYAHDRGVVHRDIKPANILLSGPNALLTDFGIARILGHAAAPGLTATGQTVGTVAYMSPEQALGDERIDHRSDLYAIGVVAYEMLSGSHPFAGSTPQQVIGRQLSQDPMALADLRPGVSPVLARIIHQLLAKNPADRPQSAEEVLRSMEPLMTGDHPVASARTVSAPRRLRWVWPAIAAIAVMAALVPVLRALRGAAHTPADGDGTIRSIAVMPMENATPDSEYSYLADGLTDDLIDALARFPNLKTISRNSVFALRGHGLTTRQLGDTLGVDALLDGSVRHLGDGMRIVLHLVRAASDSIMWSDVFESTLPGSAAVEDSIVRAIVHTLQFRVGPGSGGVPVAAMDPAAVPSGASAVATGPAPSASAEALDLLKQGQAIYHSRERLATAIHFFEQALQLDPNLAAAWAGLAAARASAAVSGSASREEWDQAKTAARRAIDLDPRSADAHAALALVQMTFDRDWSGAGANLEKAIALSPGFADAHHWYALYLAWLGHFDDAIREIRIAQDLDPISAIMMNNKGRILGLAGQSAASLREYRNLINVYPRQLSHMNLALLLEANDSLIAALAEIDSVSGAIPAARATRAVILARAGQRDEALAIARELEASSASSMKPWFFARMYAALDMKDKALSWLERGVQQEWDGFMLDLGVAPYWEPLRKEPRFNALLRELNLQ